MARDHGQRMRPSSWDQKRRRRLGHRLSLSQLESLESRNLLTAAPLPAFQGPLALDSNATGSESTSSPFQLPAGINWANTFDFGTAHPAENPVLYQPIAPYGSLIYDPPIAGEISIAGEVDDYPMVYDSQQTVTVVVIPNGTLLPQLTLSGPTSDPVTVSETASAVGQPVILQAVPTSAGQYHISVTGADGTTGDYTIEFILNALIEEESFGLSANDDPAVAQHIDTSFVTLGIGNAQRGALLGATDRASSIIYAADMEQNPGWTLQGTTNGWQHGVPTGGGDRDPAAGYTGNNVLGFNLSGNYAANMSPLYATSPRMDITGQSNVKLAFRRWLNVEGPSSDNATIEASNNGTDWTVVWHNETAIRDVDWVLQEVDLSAMAGDETSLYLRWGMGTTDDTLQYGGWNIDDVVVSSIGTGQSDWYRFTLNDGETATIATTPLDSGGISMSLFDASGNSRLAAAVVSSGEMALIPGFVDNTNDGLPTEYLVKINGGGTRYSLLITKEIDFDIGQNDTPLQASQLRSNLDGSLAVLGYASSDPNAPTDQDFYAFNAASGASLRLIVVVPGNGIGEPVNGLVPAVTLVTPSGSELVISDSLDLLTEEAGRYVVRVAASGETAGAYGLRIEGGMEIPATLTVVSTDWDSALAGNKERGQITITFSDVVSLATLQASDLLLNNVPATNLTVVDGRTIIFDLPDSYVEGTNHLAIAAGALESVAGIAIEPFALAYELDATGPVVTGISVNNGGSVATGDISITIRFDEDIQFAQIDGHDISLVGSRTGAREFASLSYDNSANELTILYRDLMEESYTLTLLSGDGRFENVAGLDLDGETTGSMVPPNLSGDGLPGGNFVWLFNGDITTTPFVGTFTPLAPVGSLVYEGAWGATIGHDDPGDSLRLELDAGQQVTLVVSSPNGLRPLLTLWDANDVVLGQALASEVGQSAILSHINVTSLWAYIIGVAGAAGTVGDFSVRILLNVGFERETLGGPENYFPTEAEDLTSYFTSVGNGNVSRASVFGRTESGTLPLAYRPIDFGATWRYLDTGADQGTAWTTIGFDDTVWSSGAAELGYGDADETTVVGFGPDQQNKFITTYFRNVFNFDHNTSRFDKLILNLKRDDGIAVYLNGTELVRDNLAALAAYDVTADRSITGAEENEIIRFEVDLDSLPSGTLRRGSNVLGVEIHQQAPDSSDISFDLQMDVVDTLATTSDFGPLSFVDAGATWRYLDNGSDQGLAWRSAEFDDSTWVSGSAQLGYGDGDEATEIGFGDDPESKHITTYFRHSFQIAGSPTLLEQLVLRLKRDDGAAVYINGYEIARSNLIANAGAFELAENPVSGADEDTFFEFVINVAELPVGTLRRGTNVVAVEVHQQSPDSSDISFDLSLTGVLVNTSSVDQQDWYSFALNDGESITIGLQLQSQGHVTLGLFDGVGGKQLATSVATPNVSHMIQGFRDNSTDGLPALYQIQIDGDPADYHLFVVRNAEFDVDPNRNASESQPATAVVGAIAGLSSDATTLQTDFAGINYHETTCSCEPPDTHVAAGPDHIVEVVNTAIAIYHKDGTVAVAPRELADFFTPTLYLGQTFDFDPVVTYDSQAERWVVVVLIGAIAGAAETDMLYAVSDTSDPTGPWTEKHRIDFSGVSPGLFADYPKIGWNADAHVITVNMFGPRDFAYINVVSIDKSTILDRNPETFSTHISRRTGDNFTMAVATMHDARPGDPMWFVQEATYGSGNAIRVVKMTGVLSDSPTYRQFDVPVGTYGIVPFGTQLFGNVATGDSRILNAEWRDGRLVATHTVGFSGKAAARWYEFDTTGVTPTLKQSVTVDGGPGVHTYYPSIAINKRGDIGINYMRSSASELIAMYVAGQSAGAAPGVMSQPVLVHYGERPYYGRRAGDYSGISVDPITDTFWAANQVMPDIGNAFDWSTWVAEFSVAEIVEEDWYSFFALAGDSLTIRAELPGGGSGEPNNELHPKLQLVGPDGSIVGVIDAPPTDGSVTLPFSVIDSGEYKVRVASGNLRSGDYLLSVSGATGDGSRPTVVDTDLFDGKRLLQFPEELLLQFSESILTASLSADDVRIGGLPATELTIVDGKTFRFRIDPLANIGEGSYLIELADGAFVDLVGAPNIPYDATFIVDRSGPKILSTSWNGQSLPAQPVFAAGDLAIELQFDEPLFTLASPRRGLRSPGNEDVVLTNGSGAVIPPQTLSFDPQTLRFRMTFANLPTSSYQLRIVSGDGAFEDVLGSDLDGEPLATPLDGTPTGDGNPGGDYVVSFIVDSSTYVADTFELIRPLGSFASRFGTTGSLESSNRLHRYETAAATGELLTVIARPVNTQAQLSLNGVTAQTPGGPVVVEARPVQDGTLLFDLRGSIATDYELEIYRQAGVEEIVGDTTESRRIDLNNYLLAVGNGLATVVGTTTLVAPTTVTVFEEDFSDGLGDFTIDNNFQSANGLWHLSTGRSADGLPGHSLPNVLYYGEEEGLAGGGNYDTGASHAGAVLSPVIQLPTADSLRLSFQHLLDRRNDSLNDIAELAIDDGTGFITLLSTALGTLPSSTQGQWLSESVDLSSYAGQSVRLRFSFDTVDTTTDPFEGWYVDDIQIIAHVEQRPDVDYFSVDLTSAAGKTVDIIVAGQQGVDFSTAVIELLDPVGTVVATSDPTWIDAELINFDSAILGYEVPADVSNDYTIRLTSAVEGRYALVAAIGMIFDTESNDLVEDSLRRVQDSGFVTGYLDAADDAVDQVEIELESGRAMLVRVSTPILDGRSSSDLQVSVHVTTSQSAVYGPLGLSVPTGTSFVVLSPTDLVELAEIRATAGSGNYLVEFYFAVISGDFDRDGLWDCVDIDRLTTAIASSDYQSDFDMSGDGVVDRTDLILWLAEANQRNLGPGQFYLPGDANLDGSVDATDFNTWHDHRFTQTPGWCQGDFNVDGFVDVADFNVWLQNRFTPPAQPAARSDVGERIRVPRSPSATTLMPLPVASLSGPSALTVASTEANQDIPQRGLSAASHQRLDQHILQRLRRRDSPLATQHVIDYALRPKQETAIVADSASSLGNWSDRVDQLFERLEHL